ncbi:MAG: hypothetical protein ACRECH_14325, partial [Nitrososphaerales archaeon]
TRTIRHITTVTIDLRNLKLNLSPALTKLLNIPVQSIELTNFRLSISANCDSGTSDVNIQTSQTIGQVIASFL